MARPRSNDPAQALARDIDRIRERAVLNADLFQRWLVAKGYSWRGLEAGDYPGMNLDLAQLLCVCEDPVLWCAAFLDDPKAAPGTPYTFFDYQKSSVRSWQQDVVHQDGAEVGKTREIIALILWGMCTALGFSIRRPSILVAAPQQTHLDEIIMAVEEHLGVDDGSSKRKPLINRFWLKPKRTPHTMFRFATPMGPGRVYFRPGGHDGEAFRGVHVTALALFDEAAKAKNRVVVSEFVRAMEPGCMSRYYSVPDGDNTSEFYRMTREAIPDLKPQQKGTRLFHWAKTLMPAPFWNEDRRRDMIRRYGGESTPGYQRNVLGLHGQQENPVWPWSVLEPNIRDVPDYVALKLDCNAEAGEMHVQAQRYELLLTQGKKAQREHYIEDRHDDLAAFQQHSTEKTLTAMRALLRDFIQPADKGVYWCGADLGFTRDPTEIMVWREIGHELRRVARINVLGMGYDLQCALIYCLDELLGLQPKWGVDFGNAGSSVVQILTNSEQYVAADYENRLTGFQFSAALDAVDENGAPLEVEDKNGEMKPLRLPAKELATNLLTARFQRAGIAMPFDPDVIGHYTNHTAKEGAKHRIFAKKDDHTIDADRVMMLRRAFDEQIFSVDNFAAGLQRRSAA